MLLPRKRVALGLLVGTGLALAGCGGSSSHASTSSATVTVPGAIGKSFASICQGCNDAPSPKALAAANAYLTPIVSQFDAAESAFEATAPNPSETDLGTYVGAVANLASQLEAYHWPTVGEAGAASASQDAQSVEADANTVENDINNDEPSSLAGDIGLLKGDLGSLQADVQPS
jgi:hypothetical protein